MALNVERQGHIRNQALGNGERLLPVRRGRQEHGEFVTAVPGHEVWRLVAADQVADGAEVVPTPAPEGESTEEATPAAATGESAEGVTIEAIDIDWNPNAMTIPADTDVTITVPNTGFALHTFVIEDAGINVAIDPGDTQEVVVNLPAGTYTYICDVPGHEEAGMVGTLTVE